MNHNQNGWLLLGITLSAFICSSLALIISPSICTGISFLILVPLAAIIGISYERPFRHGVEQ